MDNSFEIGDKVCYIDGRPMKGSSHEDVPYKTVKAVVYDGRLTKIHYTCGGWDAAYNLKHYEETEDCGFQKGDRVCKRTGRDFSNGLKVCTVDFVTDTGRVYLEETGRWMYAQSLCLEAPKPNRYAEFIIGWAQGKVVEYRDSEGGSWITIDADAFFWTDKDKEYRFKPDEKTLRKMEIEEQIEKLQKELAELEGGY